MIGYSILAKYDIIFHVDNSAFTVVIHTPQVYIPPEYIPLDIFIVFHISPKSI